MNDISLHVLLKIGLYYISGRLIYIFNKIILWKTEYCLNYVALAFLIKDSILRWFQNLNQIIKINLIFFYFAING